MGSDRGHPWGHGAHTERRGCPAVRAPAAPSPSTLASGSFKGKNAAPVKGRLWTRNGEQSMGLPEATRKTNSGCLHRNRGPATENKGQIRKKLFK